MYLFSILEFLDDTLESLMDQIEILQVAYLCLESEVVLLWFGVMEAFGEGNGQWNEGWLPADGAPWRGGAVKHKCDSREVQ